MKGKPARGRIFGFMPGSPEAAQITGHGLEKAI
jgi:hypothetical protein